MGEVKDNIQINFLGGQSMSFSWHFQVLQVFPDKNWNSWHFQVFQGPEHPALLSPYCYSWQQLYECIIFLIVSILLQLTTLRMYPILIAPYCYSWQQLYECILSLLLHTVTADNNSTNVSYPYCSILLQLTTTLRMYPILIAPYCYSWQQLYECILSLLLHTVTADNSTNVSYPYCSILLQLTTTLRMYPILIAPYCYSWQQLYECILSLLLHTVTADNNSTNVSYPYCSILLQLTTLRMYPILIAPYCYSWQQLYECILSLLLHTVTADNNSTNVSYPYCSILLQLTTTLRMYPILIAPYCYSWQQLYECILSLLLHTVTADNNSTNVSYPYCSILLQLTTTLRMYPILIAPYCYSWQQLYECILFLIVSILLQLTTLRMYPILIAPYCYSWQQLYECILSLLLHTVTADNNSTNVSYPYCSILLQLTTTLRMYPILIAPYCYSWQQLYECILSLLLHTVTADNNSTNVSYPYCSILLQLTTTLRMYPILIAPYCYSWQLYECILSLLLHTVTADNNSTNVSYPYCSILLQLTTTLRMYPILIAPYCYSWQQLYECILSLLLHTVTADNNSTNVSYPYCSILLQLTTTLRMYPILIAPYCYSWQQLYECILSLLLHTVTADNNSTNVSYPYCSILLQLTTLRMYPILIAPYCYSWQQLYECILSLLLHTVTADNSTNVSYPYCSILLQLTTTLRMYPILIAPYCYSWQQLYECILSLLLHTVTADNNSTNVSYPYCSILLQLTTTLRMYPILIAPYCYSWQQLYECILFLIVSILLQLTTLRMYPILIAPYCYSWQQLYECILSLLLHTVTADNNSTNVSFSSLSPYCYSWQLYECILSLLLHTVTADNNSTNVSYPYCSILLQLTTTLRMYPILIAPYCYSWQQLYECILSLLLHTVTADNNSTNVSYPYCSILLQLTTTLRMYPILIAPYCYSWQQLYECILSLLLHTVTADNNSTNVSYPYCSILLQLTTLRMYPILIAPYCYSWQQLYECILSLLLHTVTADNNSTNVSYPYCSILLQLTTTLRMYPILIAPYCYSWQQLYECILSLLLHTVTADNNSTNVSFSSLSPYCYSWQLYECILSLLLHTVTADNNSTNVSYPYCSILLQLTTTLRMYPILIAPYCYSWQQLYECILSLLLHTVTADNNSTNVSYPYCSILLQLTTTLRMYPILIAPYCYKLTTTLRMYPILIAPYCYSWQQLYECILFLIVSILLQLTTLRMYPILIAPYCYSWQQLYECILSLLLHTVTADNNSTNVSYPYCSILLQLTTTLRMYPFPHCLHTVTADNNSTNVSYPYCSILLQLTTLRMYPILIAPYCYSWQQLYECILSLLLHTVTADNNSTNVSYPYCSILLQLTTTLRMYPILIAPYCYSWQQLYECILSLLLHTVTADNNSTNVSYPYF